MNIKLGKTKLNLLVVIIIVLAVVVAVAKLSDRSASKNIDSPQIEISYNAEKENTTVYEALLDYGKKNNVSITSENYPELGVLVQGIGKINNGDDGKYWQYYINGTLGDVASDKKTISRTDLVVWKFEKVPESY